jgi:hypothetical protein
MKKVFFLFTLNLFFLDNVFTQNQFNCISQDVYNKQLKTNLEFKKNQELLEQETQQYLNNPDAKKSSAAAYIIPVVFHIIHTGGSGNISSAQVQDQIAILNKEFNRLQADTVLTPLAFKPLAAAFNVEFRLATKDPNGNCTNGINRIYNSLSTCSVREDDVKALSYWPSNKYLNIWIVESMHYAGNTGCNGGGYATFPGGSANLDGINIRGDLISNIGTSASNTLWGNFKGRYLIHELGHWFNLRHIWGDAFCGNDQVADTPPHYTSNSGCPNFPYNPNNTCGGNANGEMFTNYMDYTEGNCLNMFTAGQVTRMTAAITSSVSGRSNLWSNSNLIATGTNDPYTYSVACIANPQIAPYESLIICTGDSVKFTDNSYGGLSNSRQWIFNGGNALSTTDSIVYVKYANSGIYDVALTKNYLSSSKTASYTNKVYVLDNTPNLNYIVPFQDSLENPSNFDSEWVIVDRNNDGNSWELTYASSFSGGNCATINNFNKVAPTTDDLISPAYDLSAVLNPTLTFMLHFSGVTATNYDKLEVSITKDCAKSWTSIYSKTALSNLKTVNSPYSTSHIPLAASNEWRKEKVNIVPMWATGIVRFKFSFTGGGGNNIFIDDINVNGINTTGIENNYAEGAITFFPNPVQDKLTIKLNKKKQASLNMEVVDILGRKCLSEIITESAQGSDGQLIETNTLKNGVYFIRIKENNQVIYTSKFIKQGLD